MLIDTYDTEEAARKVVALAPRLKTGGISIEAVRLDSGDLIALSKSVRRILDDGGLANVTIFASGGLDEDALLAIARADAPIDGFGVGTSLTTSSDVAALKRPIAFSALDYTSAERREAACRREVELNRRTAPDLYLGVRTIRRDECDGLSFAGAGPAVDWVVVMRRFGQTDLFDHLAADNRLSPALGRDLAEEIARFHERAATMDSHGGKDGLMRAIEQNRRDQSTVEAVLGKAAIDTLFARSVDVLHRVGSLLDRRRDGGRERVCHGDLRLPNISL